MMLQPLLTRYSVDQEPQESLLTQLMTKGKEQGYLTLAEVQDHLPREIADADQIEAIVGLINAMGIQIEEVGPEVGDVMPADATALDDEAAEAAIAALASVDSEVGRTTDPTRIYMREMGSVGLLTRAGERQIALRMEEGLNQVLAALSLYPLAVETLIDRFAAVARREAKITDVILGFNDADEDAEIPLGRPAAPDPPPIRTPPIRSRMPIPMVPPSSTQSSIGKTRHSGSTICASATRSGARHSRRQSEAKTTLALRCKGYPRASCSSSWWPT